MLGLVALAWCLLIAPVLHRQTHAHGTDHSHGAPSVGNFEHQSVTFTAGAVSPVVVPVLLALVVREVAQPVAPELVSARRVEQSQAP